MSSNWGLGAWVGGARMRKAWGEKRDIKNMTGREEFKVASLELSHRFPQTVTDKQCDLIQIR